MRVGPVPEPGADGAIDPERVRSVLTMMGVKRAWSFLSLIEERLTGLTVRRHDTDAVRDGVRAAHQCAGSAATLGLIALEALLSEVGPALGSGDADRAADALAARLRATYAATLQSLFQISPALLEQANARAFSPKDGQDAACSVLGRSRLSCVGPPGC